MWRPGVGLVLPVEGEQRYLVAPLDPDRVVVAHGCGSRAGPGESAGSSTTPRMYISIRPWQLSLSEAPEPGSCRRTDSSDGLASPHGHREKSAVTQSVETRPPQRRSGEKSKVANTPSAMPSAGLSSSS